MSFRSYSQEAQANPEHFSLDEAFNLFLPESFTLSLSAVGFICCYVLQLLGFVHPTGYFTFLSSLAYLHNSASREHLAVAFPSHI